MKIKNEYGEVMRVFAIYWGNDFTNYLACPPRCKGLVAYGDNDVEILTSEIENNFVFFNNNFNGIYHRCLIENSLLDDLLENDTTAFEKFMSIVGEI